MYNKGAVKLFSFFLVFIFCISFISALDWDDKLEFTKDLSTTEWGKYEIYDSVLLLPFVKGDRLATYELIENSHSILNGYAEIDVELFSEEQILADLKVYDKRGNEVQLKSLTKTLLIEREVIEEKPIYKESCEDILNENNTMSKVCENVEIGKEEIKKTITEEIELIDYKYYSPDKYKLILRGQREKQSDGIRDWIITTGAGDKELVEWAIWFNDTFNFCRTFEIKTNATFTNATDVVVARFNFDGMQSDGGDVRIINAPCSEGGEEAGYNLIDVSQGDINLSIKVEKMVGSSFNYSVYYNSTGALTTTEDNTIPERPFDTNWGFELGTNQYWTQTGAYIVSTGCTNVNKQGSYCIISWPPDGNTGIMQSDKFYLNSHAQTAGIFKSNAAMIGGIDLDCNGGMDLSSPTGAFSNLSTSAYIGRLACWRFEDNSGTYWTGTDYMRIFDESNQSVTENPLWIDAIGAEEINFIPILNFPEDNFETSNQNVTFNCSIIDAVNLSLIIDDNLITTIFNITSNANLSLQTNQTLVEGNYNWTCEGANSEESVRETVRNFIVHLTSPTINITEPTGIIDSFALGDNQTLSWQVSEPGQNLTEHITNCSYIYNEIETQFNSSDCLIVNTTSFLYIQGVNNLTFTVTDNFGLAVSNITFWDYQILEINQTFNSPVIELSDESFELNVQVSGSITQTLLNYNGTDYVSNILSLGDGLNKITTTIQIPSFDVNENVTFFYNISTSAVSGILTQNKTQDVRILNVGNCTAFDNLLMNLSLFDEKSLESINGTIEFDLEILNPSDESLLNKLSTIFEDVSTTSVCADLNISAGNYIYSLELRYFSEKFNSTAFSHVPEFYHIQKADVSGLPQIINLFDLAVNESTEFTIFYRDDDYIARENVLLQIQRKYVDEGIFRVIEIPVTSSEGAAVGHFDLNNYKYKITVAENGVVLNTFNNPSIRCESELSGICEINLKGLASTPNADFTSNLENFFYTVDQTNSSVIVDFSIPTGESKLVNIEMVQTSAFADPITICNQSILSSAGQVECDITASIGDSSVQINIVSDSKPKGNLRATFQEDLNTSFLLNNYFIGAIMLITLILMFISSPQLMIGSSVFGLVFLGLIFILKSSTVGLALGAVAWLIVSGFIILTKLNKKAEQ